MTTSIPKVILEKYSAEEVEVSSRSGNQAFVEYRGESFSIGTMFCNCPDVSIALYVTGKEVEGNRQAVYVCLNHGTYTASALRCSTPSHSPLVADSASYLFSLAERKWRDKVRASNRPAWGYSGK